MSLVIRQASVHSVAEFAPERLLVRVGFPFSVATDHLLANQAQCLRVACGEDMSRQVRLASECLLAEVAYVFQLRVFRYMLAVGAEVW